MLSYSWETTFASFQKLDYNLNIILASHHESLKLGEKFAEVLGHKIAKERVDFEGILSLIFLVDKNLVIDQFNKLVSPILIVGSLKIQD